MLIKGRHINERATRIFHMERKRERKGLREEEEEGRWQVVHAQRLSQSRGSGENKEEWSEGEERTKRRKKNKEEKEKRSGVEGSKRRKKERRGEREKRRRRKTRERPPDQREELSLFAERLQTLRLRRGR